jgi:hypothetical protein
MASNRAIMPRAADAAHRLPDDVKGHADTRSGPPRGRHNCKVLLQYQGMPLSSAHNPIPTRSTPGPGWKQSVGPKEGLLILGRPRPPLDEIADLGFDGVWLMGVWQRSPAGIGIALTNDDLRVSFDAALPDWQPYDVVDLPTASAAMLSVIISVDEARSPAPGRRSRRVEWA